MRVEHSVGGALKIGYDLLLYRAFRHVRLPEEVALCIADLIEGTTPAGSRDVRTTKFKSPVGLCACGI